MATKGAAQASNERPIYTYSNLLPDEAIANVQVALQDVGYYFGPATGSLSVETRAALANYQRDPGLIITGAIDQPTIESLGLFNRTRGVSIKEAVRLIASL